MKRDGARAIVCHRPRPDASIRLFCFPYAGGGASCYRQVLATLPDSVELCGIELPGRQTRLHDAHAADLGAQVADLHAEIGGWLNRPFAFFGHSMGGWLAYALACRLFERPDLPHPQALLISACRAPSVPFRLPHLHRLDDAALLAALCANGAGGPAMEPALFDLLKHTLRRDLALLETWSWASLTRLPLPVHVFGGREDAEVSLEALAAWRTVTSGAFTHDQFPGGHFFIHQDPTLFSGVLCKRLQQQAISP
jgi:surfactin synthase thioesterase subunit